MPGRGGMPATKTPQLGGGVPGAPESSTTPGTSAPSASSVSAPAIATPPAPVIIPKIGEAPPPSNANAPSQSPPLPSAQSLNMNFQDLARVTRGFAGRKSAQKWLNQMNDRGWTPEQIEEALNSGQRIPESQRVDPSHAASRYIHPRTGRSVTIDDVTGQVIQLGEDGFDY